MNVTNNLRTLIDECRRMNLGFDPSKCSDHDFANTSITTSEIFSVPLRLSGEGVKAYRRDTEAQS